MKSLINIEIKDSFNKKDGPQKNIEDVVDSNVSTLNNAKNILETYSASISSITSGHVENNIVNVVKKQKGFWRDVIIGTISAILSAIVIYFIFGIK